MELWTALLLGLAGSPHCAGMCGPLALALPAPDGARRARFFAGRMAYNLGRIFTYCVMGAVFGLIGRTVVLAGFQRAISIILGSLLLAGLFVSWKRAWWRPVLFLVEQVKSRMAFLLRRRTFGAQFGLGILNGWLPCGLVYVACAGAAASAGPGRGVIYMASFGAGTLPMMLAIGLSGRLIPFGLRLKLMKAAPVAVFVLAVLLILRGFALGIPYVSPDLSAGGAACCHP